MFWSTSIDKILPKWDTLATILQWRSYLIYFKSGGRAWPKQNCRVELFSVQLKLIK